MKRHFRVKTMQECTTPEAGFGDMLMEPHPTKGFEHQGKWCRLHRYSLCWGGFEPDYRPASAEKLAAARQKRQEKAERIAMAEIEEEASSSLFPDWVRAVGREDFEAKQKGRRR